MDFLEAVESYSGLLNQIQSCVSGNFPVYYSKFVNVYTSENDAFFTAFFNKFCPFASDTLFPCGILPAVPTVTCSFNVKGF